MQQLKKIMAPTGFSRNSRAGLKFALSLAADYRADLLVLHVASESAAWEIPDEAGFFSAKAYTWEVDRIVREASLDLNRFLEKHGEEIRKVPTVRKKIVLGNNVAARIVDVAQDEKVDLIVMSPRAHGMLRRFFVGSATDKVTRQAPCPVLSICQPQLSRPWRGRLFPSALLPLRYEEANT